MAQAGLRLLERILEALDWIAAVPAALYAAGALLLGAVVGVFALGNPGAGRSVVWSLAIGLAMGITAALCVAAALAMRRRHRLRWWLQGAIVPAFIVLTTLAMCLSSDVSVAFGPWTVCGR